MPQSLPDLAAVRSGRSRRGESEFAVRQEEMVEDRYPAIWNRPSDQSQSGTMRPEDRRALAHRALSAALATTSRGRRASLRSNLATERLLRSNGAGGLIPKRAVTRREASGPSARAREAGCRWRTQAAGQVLYCRRARPIRVRRGPVRRPWFSGRGSSDIAAAESPGLPFQDRRRIRLVIRTQQ